MSCCCWTIDGLLDWTVHHIEPLNVASEWHFKLTFKHHFSLKKYRYVSTVNLSYLKSTKVIPDPVMVLPGGHHNTKFAFQQM